MKTKNLLREDVRRIVGFEEVLASLRDPKNSPRIPGGKGIVKYDQSSASLKDSDSEGGEDDKKSNVKDASEAIKPGEIIQGMEGLVDCKTGEKINLQLKGPKPNCEKPKPPEFYWRTDHDSSTHGRVEKNFDNFEDAKQHYIDVIIPLGMSSHGSKMIKKEQDRARSLQDKSIPAGQDFVSIAGFTAVGSSVFEKHICKAHISVCAPKPPKDKPSLYYFDEVKRCFILLCPPPNYKDDCKRKMELCDKDGNKVDFDVNLDSIDIKQEKFKQVANVNSSTGKVNYIRKT